MSRFSPYSLLARCVLFLLVAAAVLALALQSARAAKPSGLVMKIVMVEDEDEDAKAAC